ncbi:tRNA (N(6)-L-threonylcarbamoyladenosine(37)-C(2))-methylthiotransferase MtaB [Desulfurobacterium indicum]|uniref:Threonylcarbamoyladenosine tRNA methylthiotransferase MtaB n=1 Tax=Desulfurobacterium indicum TaxID=1914305 RepID=A0A1R1MMX8_9BACT|nr:tRNA (N(6)-L-threonylcarbamoyladenosine(37)-C(2))-methylthiotransferase MtaB [Desulfurobacterium indicum]OMH41178.1 tRNA (N(6)-L-threonylcarbamoyladenosine(37)-C(2))-methylthiotransferase MtaB [Desulfurobacterium indicum]
MKKVAFYTLGCKMNFHETAFMEEAFKKAGYTVVPFSEVADVYVINTCTVTASADAKSRKAIRRAKRINPESLVVVTGCYSEVYPEIVSSIKEADIVTGNVEKFRLVEIVERRTKGVFLKGTWNVTEFQPLMNADYGKKSRAFLKIQQGCESFCSYCIIPKARGRMLSEIPEKVIEHVEMLVNSGYVEIVLTGTHLGAYGKDLGNVTLADLLEKIVEIPGNFWIRLSSIEPQEFSDRLLEIVSSDKIAPHFHIPLQSGSEKILEKMGRKYTLSYYESLAFKLADLKKDVCIGTDVIVGFPGESDEDFQTMKKFIEALPFGYLHVFTYSPRKGTRAALLKDDVSQVEKKKRSRELLALSTEKNLQFRKQFKGKTLRAVALNRSDKNLVLTGNYIQIEVNKKPDSKFVDVMLKEVGKKREDNVGTLA